MFQKLLSVTLIMVLINLAGIRVGYAESKEEKLARQTEKVRAGILKLGTGEAAQVQVKLRDKSKVEGYISAAGGESFRSEEHTSELQSQSNLVCRLLLEKKKKK